MAVIQVPLLSQWGNESPRVQVLEACLAGLGRQTAAFPVAGSSFWGGFPGWAVREQHAQQVCEGGPGQQATQFCALCRCHSPLLLKPQGTGPLECEGAREREDSLEGSRHLGNETCGWSTGQPFHPAPSFLPSLVYSFIHSCMRSSHPMVSTIL